MACNVSGDKVCWLYWIHRKSHTDILTQGYIGVSINTHERFTEHKRLLRKDSGNRYRTDFKNAYKEGDLVFDILLKSNQGYCMEIERKLRPMWCIGWNIAIGGSGGVGTHGFSKTPYYSIFKGVKKKAKMSGLKICDLWNGDDAVENFVNFYMSNVPEGYIMSLPESGVISPDTVKITTRKEVVNARDRIHQIEEGGEFYSLSELGEKFGLKPSTICCRLARGNSIRVACYLDDPPPKGVRTEDGRIISYRGKLSEEEFRNFVRDYEAGVSFPFMAKKYNIHSSMLSRAGKLYGLSRPIPTYITFMGTVKRLSIQSKLSTADYELVKDYLLSGWKYKELARHFKVDYTTIHDVVEKLEWKEYNGAS